MSASAGVPRSSGSEQTALEMARLRLAEMTNGGPTLKRRISI